MLLPVFIFVFALDLILGIYAADVERPKLEWWQKSVFYHLYPRSFMDGNGDGVGDIRGMIDSLPQHLHDLGIGAVWLSPIFKSPMRDFGYDISDYKQIEKIFGTMEDYVELKNKLHELGIKLLVDFVPNHCSTDHEWFQKSVNREAPYEDYFVWMDPAGFNGSTPQPPNYWKSEFGGSAWEYNAKRKQFYLHQFLETQADLNYRSPSLVEAMKDVLRFWLDKGVDGFRLDAMPYLFEKLNQTEDQQNKNVQDNYDPNVMIRNQMQPNSRDQPDVYEMAKQWRAVLDETTKKDGQVKVMLFEAYTFINYTMKYYEDIENSMPLNFYLLIGLNQSSTAYDFDKIIHTWMDNMPKGRWPNWVLGNHDRFRIATKMGPELTDAMNMLNLLLPGTPVVYNGEEIGMQDTFISWEDTVDTYGKECGQANYLKCTRDPCRTPFQWNSNTSAGFSTNPKTWLPVNPNYYYLNLQAQKSNKKSHYNVFKRLTKLRNKDTFLYGDWKSTPLSKTVFILTRNLTGEATFILVINLSSYIENIPLDKLTTEPKLFVHTPSINLEHEIGDEVTAQGLSMRPKSSVVLTTSKQSIDPL